MKSVTVVPLKNERPTLGTLLDQTERRLRGKGTTFLRAGKHRWKHAKYPGWITWDQSKGGILVAEVKSKRPGSEWQLLQSFIGYLDRHIGEYLDAISIRYYPATKKVSAKRTGARWATSPATSAPKGHKWGPEEKRKLLAEVKSTSYAAAAAKYGIRPQSVWAILNRALKPRKGR